MAEVCRDFSKSFCLAARSATSSFTAATASFQRASSERLPVRRAHEYPVSHARAWEDSRASTSALLAAFRTGSGACPAAERAEKVRLTAPASDFGEKVAPRPGAEIPAKVSLGSLSTVSVEELMTAGAVMARSSDPVEYV